MTSSARPSSRTPPVIGAALAALVLSLAPAGLGGFQQPTFRASAEVVLVEVQVVDASGHPARGLTPADFDVRIDGRRRRVVTTDLVTYASSGTTTVAGSGAYGPAARNLWPADGAAEGRMFVLAIDAASLSMTDAANVVTTARGFVDALGAGDAVGVVSLPSGTMLRPTTDRAVLAQTLSKVVGLQNLRPNPFHLSASEIIDINAEIDQMNAEAMTTVTARGRAQVTTVQEVLRQVQTRECRGATDQVCLGTIMIDAESQARHLEEQVTDSLLGLRRLLTFLGEFAGRKTVVVLSGGMPVSDRAGGWHRDGSEARALGRAAAQADATVYAIHIDAGVRGAFAAENRLMRSGASLVRERDVQQRILADFASASGGILFEAPTDTGGRALGRVLTETSAFYAIGVEPDARDFDGRPHELRVAVSIPSVSVRSRRFVVLRRLAR